MNNIEIFESLLEQKCENDSDYNELKKKRIKLKELSNELHDAYVKSVEGITDTKEIDEIFSNYKKNDEKVYVLPYNNLKKTMHYLEIKEKVINKIIENALYNIVIEALKNEIGKNSIVFRKPVYYKVVKNFMTSIFDKNYFFQSLYDTDKETRLCKYGVMKYDKREVNWTKLKNYSFTYVFLYHLLDKSETHFDEQKVQAAQYKRTDYDIEKETKNLIECAKHLEKMKEEFENNYEVWRDNLGEFKGIADDHKVIVYSSLP